MKRRVLLGCFVILLIGLLATPDVSAAQFQEQDYVARHSKEDREWARKTGLSAQAVRNLRLLADVPDDSDTLIDHIDARNLRARNQVLLVTTSGNGHCLELFVFARRGTRHKLIWSATEMPSGAGYCRQSSHNPEAYVTRSGSIVVKIPAFDYKKLKPEATDFYFYVWNGGVYKYAGNQAVSARHKQSRSQQRRNRTSQCR
jgi:hypothetical protein